MNHLFICSIVRVKKSKRMNSNNEIHSILKCAFCKTLHCAVYAYPSTGELVCEKCVPGQGYPIPGVLKLPALEAIIKLEKLPCKFKVSGCEEQLPVDLLVEHELKCIYRPYTCIVKNCQWNGLQVDLHKHFHNVHNLCVHVNNIQLKAFVGTTGIQDVILTVVDNAVFIIEYQYNSEKELSYKISYVSPYIKKAIYNIYNETESISLREGECTTLHTSVLELLTHDLRNSTLIFKIKSVRYDEYVINRSLINNNKCSQCMGYLMPRSFDLQPFGSICGECATQNSVKCVASTKVNKYFECANIPCRWNFCFYTAKPVEMYLHQNKCRFRHYKCVDIACCQNSTYIYKDLKDMEQHLVQGHSMIYFAKQYLMKSFTNPMNIFTITKENEFVLIKIQKTDEVSFSVDVKVTGFHNQIPVYVQCEHKHCSVKSEMFCVIENITITTSSFPSCFGSLSEVSLAVTV